MKHTTFSFATAFFLLGVFGIFNTTAMAEQILSRNTPHPYENSEIMNNVNSSIDRLDTAISHLTSQMEESIHTQKQTLNATNNNIKDIKQQLKDLHETQDKLSREIALQKIEIENLKNITSMYAESVKKLENASPIQQSEPNKKTVLKPADVKIDSSIIADDIQIIKTKEAPVAPATPSELLLPNPTKQDEIETEAKSTTNPNKYTDDETFNMAFATYESKNYTDSAIQFAANIKAFPNGKNFYKNLFYLGRSMQNVNNKVGACTAFAKIIHSKEKIDPTIKTDAEREFGLLKCNAPQTSATTKK